MVIILGFAVLGSVFMYRVNLFSAQEKQTQLDKAVSQSVGFMQNYIMFSGLPDATIKLPNGLSISVRPEAQLMQNLAQLAADGGGHIFVADSAGQTTYVSSWEYGCRKQSQGIIAQAAVDEILRTGVYGMRVGNFYGALTGLCFVQGEGVYLEGELVAMVFAAIPPDNVLYHNLSQVFLLLTLVVLFVVLVVTIVVVRGLLRPLSQMANVARAFVRGDFSARVPLPARQDELYDMTVSFNSMAEAMENAENNRRGLIASVSHDLRTPMTTIGGFVDGILDGTIKPENQEKYLRIVSDEVKRLARMASSMVEVSRLESGERDLSRVVFDMSELVRRVVISFEHKLALGGVEVALDIPDTASMNGDHDSLFQVVYNLMDNAVKFTEKGGTITIFMEEKGGSLKFHIINTGGEIKPEDQKRIFDRFFKGDQSRNTSGSGSGLGLYIARTVINRHNGDIYVKSGNGKTEFVFTLPTEL